MNARHTFYILICLVFGFANSCNIVTIPFTLLYSTDEPIGEISKKIETVLEANYDVDIQLIIGEGSDSNLDSLASGKVDFTITENHVDFREGISTVLVFYPQILHIFYQGDINPTSFKDLFENRKVFIGMPGSGSYKFIMSLFDFFQVDQSKVTITENAFDDFAVFAGFNDILPSNYLLGLETFKLYSFDAIDNYGKGSIAEAICLKYPKVRPYVIPQSTYGDLTKEPILTISSDAVLVCRSTLRDEFVKDQIKTIFQERQEFASISPLIYTGLNESFDRKHLTFPLHNGARIFLDRDEPGFFERYAELVGVLFSVVIAIVSGIISLSKWQKQKKKDRVDVFYKVLMDIKNESAKLTSVKDTFEKIKEIQASQNKAFEMLINEELEANESFRIFMELSKETIAELRGRAKVLREMEERRKVTSA